MKLDMTFIAQQRLFARSARIRKNRRKKTEKFCTTAEITILTETLSTHSSALPCNKLYFFFNILFYYFLIKNWGTCYCQSWLGLKKILEINAKSLFVVEKIMFGEHLELRLRRKLLIKKFFTVILHQCTFFNNYFQNGQEMYCQIDMSIIS